MKDTSSRLYIFIYMAPFSSIHFACTSLAHIHWHIFNTKIIYTFIGTYGSMGKKLCGMVSERWVDLTWFGRKGREKVESIYKIELHNISPSNHWGDQDTTVKQQHKQQRVERLHAWASRNKFVAAKGAKIRAQILDLQPSTWYMSLVLRTRRVFFLW